MTAPTWTPPTPQPSWLPRVRDLEALPSRQGHWVECCHHVEAPRSSIHPITRAGDDKHSQDYPQPCTGASSDAIVMADRGERFRAHTVHVGAPSAASSSTCATFPLSEGLWQGAGARRRMLAC